jgi:peroxiredoxin Q/BCP
VLKEGDKVPAALLRASFDASFAGSDTARPVTLAELGSAGRTLVLYFYPKDSTPGCTRQAQGFTASKKAIEKAGGVVVGVSRDSVKSHCSFRDKYDLAIPLVSDPDRKLHEGFGAWGEKVMYGKKILGAIRSTFLIKDGVVAKVWSRRRPRPARGERRRRRHRRMARAGPSSGRRARCVRCAERA